MKNVLMKALLFLQIYLMLILAFSTNSNVFAQSSGQLILSLPNEGTLGSQFNVGLSVSNFENFGVDEVSWFEFDLVYDPSIMKPINTSGSYHSKGSLVSDFTVLSTNDGNVIRVVGFGGTFEGNGQMLNFTFELVGVGQGGINLRNVFLTGVSAERISNTRRTIVSNAVSDIVPSSVSLNISNFELKQGDSERLIATVRPADARDKSVQWSTSNSRVATVDQNGNVRGVNPGTATITSRTTVGNLTATANVIVVADNGDQEQGPQETRGIVIHGNTTMAINTVDYLRAVFVPVAPENPKVIWASSNTNVATVDSDGRITGITEGKTVITVTSSDGKHSAGITLNVVNALTLTNVKAVSDTMEMIVGDIRRPNLVFTPSEGVNRDMKWVSSDFKVVDVNERGDFIALSEGEATLNGTSVSGNHRVRITITVKPLPVDRLIDMKYSIENDHEVFIFPRTVFFKGDYLEIKDDNISIIISRKVLDESFAANGIVEYENFEIHVTRSRPNISLENFSILSDIYEFKLMVDGHFVSNFSGDVIKEFQFDRQKIKNFGGISLYYYNGEINEWERLRRNEVDFNSGKIKIRVNHWSKFLLMEDLLLSEALSNSIVKRDTLSTRGIILIISAFIGLCILSILVFGAKGNKKSSRHK